MGAQAVYFYTRSLVLSDREHTVDGDLVLNPSLLADQPALEELLIASGFRPPESEVGRWTKIVERDGRPDEIYVDLLVPEGAARHSGRRSVKLKGHHGHAARKASGLEACLVDRELRELAALDPDDRRKFQIHVAGAAALLVAKLHKLADRASEPERVKKNDAYRLLQAGPTIPISALPGAGPASRPYSIRTRDSPATSARICVTLAAVLAILSALFGALVAAFRPRASLVAENLVLAPAARGLEARATSSVAASDGSRLLGRGPARLGAMGGRARDRETGA